MRMYHNVFVPFKIYDTCLSILVNLEHLATTKLSLFLNFLCVICHRIDFTDSKRNSKNFLKMTVHADVHI